MNTESSEKSKVVVLGDFASNKPRKQETPYDRVQKVIRQRTGEVIVKKPTSFIEWKKEKEAKQELNSEEKPLYEKLHLDKTEDQWEKYFNDYLDQMYGDEMEFCYDEYEEKDQFIYKYISKLLFDIATDSEYGQEIVAGLKKLETLQRGKFKGDVGIYLFLEKNYQASDNVTEEIKKCYMAWYEENKEKNVVGLYMKEKIANFLPIIYSISKDIPLFRFEYEMEEEGLFDDEED